MREEKDTNVSDIKDDEELDEEPGEVIESAPPLRVGEEREVNSSGLKKKLLKRGQGWETPEFGDEVTVNYVGFLLDGSKFDSSRDKGEAVTFKLGHGEFVNGLDHGVITMKKGELALFTLPCNSENGTMGGENLTPGAVVQFEIELLSWIPVVDVCKDGGIIKRVLVRGKRDEQPNDLDEVTVKYQVMLADGSIVAETPDDGLEFCIKDGYFCPALPKVLKTMKRGEQVNLVVQPQYAFGQNGLEACNGHPGIPSNSMLNIDLKLMSLKPVIDVTGDAKVLKKILKEGEGTYTANEGGTAVIRYTKLEDGTMFERKGLDGDSPLEFIIDEDQVIVGLDRAATTMKRGELSILTIKPEYGFGNAEVKRDLAVIPPLSTLVYEIEMLDFTKEKTPWEMNSHEKIAAAGLKKQDGNILFKSGKYQQAANRYDKAVDYISEEISFGDDERKLVKALRVSCWLNHAACSLKLSKYREAIDLCSKVLDNENHNVKALYRRAQAYMNTADFYLSELDIKRALELDHSNREVKSMQKTLKQLQSESNKRDTKLYTDMFSRMRKETSIVTKD